MTQFLIKGEKILYIEELIPADTEEDALEIFHGMDHTEAVVSEGDVEIFEVIELREGE